MTSTQNDRATDAIVKRAMDRFHASRHELMSDTDRLFGWLLIGQWLFAIFLAVTISPWAWSNKSKVVHFHVWIAVGLGAAIISLPVALSRLRPGATMTRHVIVAAQALLSALLIHLTGGRIETHFHVFGSLAFIAFYQDWPVLVTASVVVAVEHFVRGMLWPESVYGVTNPEWWRFLEHGFWVVFCVAFLILASIRAARATMRAAENGAMLEALAEGEWKKSSVVERAAADSEQPK
jgi:hypothetical protein